MKILLKTLGIMLIISTLNAVDDITDDVIIGTPETPQRLIVDGPSRFDGSAIIGTTDVHAKLTVRGNATFGAQTTLNDKNNCKRTFGVIHNFDPNSDQLAFKFKNRDESAHGGILEFSFFAKAHTQDLENQDSSIITIAKGIYLHPTHALKCFDAEGISRVNELDGNTDVSDSEALQPFFRKNNAGKICVGLIVHKHVHEGDMVYEPGSLFYCITSSNLDSIAITGIHNIDFDGLPESLQELIISMTPDVNEQKDIASILVGFGDDFISLLTSFDQETQRAIINAILNDLGRSLTHKLETRMKTKNKKKVMKYLSTIATK